jgi:hypothetical protein
VFAAFTQLLRNRAQAALFCGLLLAACRQDMHDQPKLEPLEASRFFPDGMASRPPVSGTVARGQLQEDPHLHAGVDASGKLADQLPFELTRERLTRGRELYETFCVPCHDYTGGGSGMIVRRGFKQPESFHSARLRQQPLGHFFDVITHGFGEMSSYRAPIDPEERWEIAAYVRVLQMSQNQRIESLSAEERQRLSASAAPRGEQSAGREAGG